MCAACGMSVNACRSCGESLVAGDRYCPRCGTFVDPTAPGTLSVGTGQLGQFDDQWRRIVDRLRAATVGEFEVIGEIGRGGMAVVCLGREVALNRKVAIKIMSPALLTGQGMIDRFRAEAITVANLSHPNIITIHAVRQIDDLHFFVMKFVEGRSLDSILRDHGTLSVGMVRALMFMVGSALAYAHRRGVIHRDTKPANILIDVDGSAVVTDFGIAKATGGQNHTQTGAILGTLAYMSPEQCYGNPVSAASDQYSLGVVAFELLTGAPPFSGSTYTVMHAHAEHPVPSMRARRADCPPELEAAIVRMMAKNPVQRFPSLTEALGALGATALPEDHPVRLELAELARGTHPRLPLTPQPTLPNQNNELTRADGGTATAPSTPSAAGNRVGETASDARETQPVPVPRIKAPPATAWVRSRTLWFALPAVVLAAVVLTRPLWRSPVDRTSLVRDSLARLNSTRPPDPATRAASSTSTDSIKHADSVKRANDAIRRADSIRRAGPKVVKPPVVVGGIDSGKGPLIVAEVPDSNLPPAESLRRVREQMARASAQSDSGKYVRSTVLYEEARQRAQMVQRRFPASRATAAALIEEIRQRRDTVRTACKSLRDWQISQKRPAVDCP